MEYLHRLHSKTTVKVNSRNSLLAVLVHTTKNGVAKRNIKTVAQWAQANMLHLALHWPTQATVSFWPQAIEYSVWVFNQMQNTETGISPKKKWSSV